MDNILYIDDYINLYNKEINKIIEYKPYKNTLDKGRIIDKEKFIKVYNKLLKDNNLNNKIFGSSISVIINQRIKKEDKEVIYNTLIDLNYKRIKFIKETNYLNITKKDLYIIYNYNYFYLYYLNSHGNIESLIYDYDKINNLIIINIIRLLKKSNVYIFGKNYQELLNIIQKSNLNYYYFYDSSNLILKKIIYEKLM